MRVIYLHQTFTTPGMAGGTRSYEMARRLVLRGHEVHMVASDRTGCGRGWLETEEAGIHVHWCPVRYSKQMGYNRRIGAFMQFAWLAARKAARLPGDVVFATSTPLTIALPGVYAARRKSLPMVFEVRDLWPEMPIAVGALKSRFTIGAARRLESFAYRNAAHVVALAPGMKEGIVATGYPQDRVTVIPNSCDLQTFRVAEETGRGFRRSRAWLQDRPLVVYCGALSMANGVDYLARLAAVVQRRDPEIRFLVLGTGAQEQRIRRLAKELDVWERNFFMRPPIPKREMPAVLSAADIATCLLIDVKEIWVNSPNKVFDGLAAGRPVAVNNAQGWIPELIRRTGCGLVMDPEDMDSAAGQLLAAIRDPTWLSKARAAARKVGRERFSRDKLAMVFESVLSSVVDAPERRLAA